MSKARQLFACYRKSEAADPELYLAAVVVVFGEYKREVIEYVADPRTGLPSTQKFLPSVAEVREACEARASQLWRAASYQQRIDEQTRKTEEWLNSKPSERLKAMGKAWLDRTDPIAADLCGGPYAKST